MEKTPSNVMRIPYVWEIFPEAKYLYVIREPLACLSSANLRWELKKGIKRRRAWQRFQETAKTQLHWYAGRAVMDYVNARLLGNRIAYFGVRYPGFARDVHRLAPLALAATQWVKCAQQADVDLPGIPPESLLRFRYEELVENPVEHFNRILDHVGLAMTGELESKLREWVDPGRRDKWRRLERETLASILPILRDEVLNQGYSIPEELEDLVEQADPT
jgi:hypothetical protein